MRGFQAYNTGLIPFQRQSLRSLTAFLPIYGEGKLLYAHFLRPGSPNLQPHYPSQTQSTNVPCLSLLACFEVELAKGSHKLEQVQKDPRVQGYPHPVSLGPS